MRKVVIQIFLLIIAISLGITIFSVFNIHQDIYEGRYNRDFSEVNDYEHEWITEYSEILGGYDRVSFDVKSLGDFKSGTDISFYLVHQSLRAYVDNELVYSVSPSADNAFGKTIGCEWVSFPLYDSDWNKTVVLEFIPAYAPYKGKIPIIYTGNKWNIFQNRLKSNFGILLLAIFEIIVGIIFLGWTIYVHLKNVDAGSLGYLGCFSILIGIWKINDIDVSNFIFGYPYTLSLLSLIAISIVLIPFVLYIDSLIKSVNCNINLIPCIIFEIIFIVSLILQMSGIYDVRELLKIIHAEICFTIVIIVAEMIYDIKKNGISKELRFICICVIICCVGAIYDGVIYYIKNNSMNITSYGSIGFSIFILLLGIRTMWVNYQFVEKGKRAQMYQDMAYTDKLTGVYSRLAYNDYLSKVNSFLENVSIVVVDLNNLKFCNDSCGHEAGDRYIKECADILVRVFGDKGKCFRIGGDEFCIILEDMSYKECENAVQRIRSFEKIFNESGSESFKMQMACGFTHYDEETDYDVIDTVRRADKYMYINKVSLKNSDNS